MYMTSFVLLMYANKIFCIVVWPQFLLLSQSVVENDIMGAGSPEANY